jgi:hypothetical protein
VSQKESGSLKANERARISLRVTPRAKWNNIAGVLEDGTVKIRVTAPPVDGKANQALIKYLAEFLGIAKSKIEIVSGENNRNKVVEVIGMGQMELLERISGELKS